MLLPSNFSQGMPDFPGIAQRQGAQQPWGLQPGRTDVTGPFPALLDVAGTTNQSWSWAGGSSGRSSSSTVQNLAEGLALALLDMARYFSDSCCWGGNFLQENLPTPICKVIWRTHWKEVLGGENQGTDLMWVGKLGLLQRIWHEWDQKSLVKYKETIAVILFWFIYIAN